MKKCPKCELNYINDDEELCSVCNPSRPDVKRHNNKTFNPNKTDEERTKETIQRIGLSWAICYLYYKHIDHSFENYKLVSTYPSRQAACDKNENLISKNLMQPLNQNELLLNANTLNVNGQQVLDMAKKLADYYTKKQNN